MKSSTHFKFELVAIMIGATVSMGVIIAAVSAMDAAVGKLVFTTPLAIGLLASGFIVLPKLDDFESKFLDTPLPCIFAASLIFVVPSLIAYAGLSLGASTPTQGVLVGLTTMFYLIGIGLAVRFNVADKIKQRVTSAKDMAVAKLRGLTNA